MSNGRFPSRSTSSRFPSRNLLKNGSNSSKVYDCSKLVESNKLIPNVSDNADEKNKSIPEDFVSGILYDMLQKEILTLQKTGRQKDQNLEEKDNMIEILARNVETLNKAMEVEGKRMRRALAAMEKELAALRVGKDRETRMGRRTSVPRLHMNIHSFISLCIF